MTSWTGEYTLEFRSTFRLISTSFHGRVDFSVHLRNQDFCILSVIVERSSNRHKFSTDFFFGFPQRWVLSPLLPVIPTGWGDHLALSCLVSHSQSFVCFILDFVYFVASGPIIVVVSSFEPIGQISVGLCSELFCFPLVVETHTPPPPTPQRFHRAHMFTASSSPSCCHRRFCSCSVFTQHHTT